MRHAVRGMDAMTEGPVCIGTSSFHLSTSLDCAGFADASRKWVTAMAIGLHGHAMSCFDAYGLARSRASDMTVSAIRGKCGLETRILRKPLDGEPVDIPARLSCDSPVDRDIDTANGRLHCLIARCCVDT